MHFQTNRVARKHQQKWMILQNCFSAAVSRKNPLKFKPGSDIALNPMSLNSSTHDLASAVQRAAPAHHNKLAALSQFIFSLFPPQQ